MANYIHIPDQGSGGGGSGDVVGPSSAVDNDIAVFDGTTGKLIKDGGMTIAQILAIASGTPNNTPSTVVARDSNSYFDTTRIYFDRINSFQQYFDFSTMTAVDTSNVASIDLINRHLLNYVGGNMMDWSATAVFGPLIPSSVGLYFQATDASGNIGISAPGGVTSYSMVWPGIQSAGTQVLTNDGSGNLSWTTPGGAPTFVNITSDQALAYNTINSVDTSSSRNLTLPDPSVQGNVIVIKDTTGAAQSSPISILQFGSEQIEGIAATKLLQTDWGSWTFYSNTTNWFMI